MFNTRNIVSKSKIFLALVSIICLNNMATNAQVPLAEGSVPAVTQALPAVSDTPVELVPLTITPIPTEELATIVLPLTGKTIIINPGHGGRDTGAKYGGVEEKTITLAIALKVRNMLKSLGATVVMTRESDVTMRLPEIDSVTSKIMPDAFLAIHCNAGGKKMHGIESFYFYPESNRYADLMLQSVSQELGKTANFSHHNNFYVIDHTRVPATLVEVGYLSNRQDRAYLTNSSDQDLIATALSDGLVKYFSGEKSR